MQVSNQSRALTCELNGIHENNTLCLPSFSYWLTFAFLIALSKREAFADFQTTFWDFATISSSPHAFLSSKKHKLSCKTQIRLFSVKTLKDTAVYHQCRHLNGKVSYDTFNRPVFDKSEIFSIAPHRNPYWEISLNTNWTVFSQALFHHSKTTKNSTISGFFLWQISLNRCRPFEI